MANSGFANAPIELMSTQRNCDLGRSIFSRACMTAAAFTIEGHRSPTSLGHTRQSVRFRPSRSPRAIASVASVMATALCHVLWPQDQAASRPLGGVTEAPRSDTAGATVQLRPERLNKENVMEQVLPNKPAHVLIRSRGVTAAQRAFTSPGGVQIPPALANNTGSRC